MSGEPGPEDPKHRAGAEAPERELDRLTVLTGIDRRHLAEMALGRLLPGPEHLPLLRRHLSEEELARYTRHGEPTPEVFAGEAGGPPSGYRLIRERVPREELRRTDLIAFRPSLRRVRGTRWVEIVEEPRWERGMNLVVTLTGDVTVTLTATITLRVARRIG